MGMKSICIALKVNSLEQLCINFTNERLQAHFMDALVKLQQEEYKREGVVCEHITFPDNSAQIELFDSKRGGIFSMLDDECSVPKGTIAGRWDVNVSLNGEIFQLASFQELTSYGTWSIICAVSLLGGLRAFATTMVLRYADPVSLASANVLRWAANCPAPTSSSRCRGPKQ